MRIRRAYFSATVLMAAATIGHGAARADGMPGSLKDSPIVAAAPCNWGGAYAGLDTGVSRTRTNWRLPDDEPDLTGNRTRVRFFDNNPGDHFNVERTRWVGSGHVGYNLPTTTPWVMGVELAYTGGKLDKAETSRFDANDTFRTSIKEIVEIKGRLGYSVGCWMGYAKAGFATGRVETSGSGTSRGGVTVPIEALSETERHNGYTIGGGIEYMLTPYIVLGFEYDHVDLGSRRTETPVLFTNTRVQGSTLTRDVDVTADLFVGRLTFKFGQ